MARQIKVGFVLAGLLLLGSGVATAQNREEQNPNNARPPVHGTQPGNRPAAAPMSRRPLPHMVNRIPVPAGIPALPSRKAGTAGPRPPR
jgi:hypothetical protein